MNEEYLKKHTASSVMRLVSLQSNKSKVSNKSLFYKQTLLQL
ncbi:hypothetical protein M2465_002981 [Parabacteroides sp. PH5-17]|nr:hypothetical protein [Parabacteroides sp. PH5-39]MDH6324675.1 hypothetical protein [Parabacteroides sp. PH5-8]MDH6385787.1 hypothetical protein [Parabacteroides sp. PH5-17]MDH6395040.1 hypothetical protein [Parabacteroides sp. PFB2-22]